MNKIGFIKPVHQAEWIANVVPIPKKDGDKHNARYLSCDGTSE